MSNIKALLPKWVLKIIRPIYHGAVAVLANIYFGLPSEKMVIIGITGTAGKSTTSAMLAHILNFGGKKCGYITTVDFFDGDNHQINKHGLSMPGGWLLQKSLLQMVGNGCRFAIVECTSEGLAQNRHLGINFDVALFTNLSRAHMDAHGSFGNYKEAKGKLFKAVGRGRKKSFFPQKMIGVNIDDAMSGYFLSFPAEKKFGITFRNVQARIVDSAFYATITGHGVPLEFQINKELFKLNLPGDFNAQNASLAVVSAVMLGIGFENIGRSLKSFQRCARADGKRSQQSRAEYYCGLWL